MTGEGTPLAGQVAVVTGASRGIGRDIAVHLAGAGCDLVVAARTVAPRSDLPGTIDETAALVRAAGRRCTTVRADLTVEADVAAVAQAALETHGRVDILVNNAAALDERTYESFWDMTSASWRYQIDLNLTSVWLMTKAVAPIMRSRGCGLVANITSALAGAPRNPNLPGQGSTGAAYPASKVAVSRLTQDLDKELAPHGIGIVAIHPGVVRTDNGDRLAAVGGFDMEQFSRSSLAASTTIAHLAEHGVGELAGTVVFAPDFAAGLAAKGG